MRYCIFCGVRIPPDAKYCQICGQEQPDLAGENAGLAVEAETPDAAQAGLTGKILSQSPAKLIAVGAAGFLIIVALLTATVILALGN